MIRQSSSLIKQSFCVEPRVLLASLLMDTNTLLIIILLIILLGGGGFYWRGRR
jgi:hypothetical protein